MKSYNNLVVLAIAILLSLAACAPTSSGTPAQTATSVLATPAPVNPTSAVSPTSIAAKPASDAPKSGQDPQNATYTINGQPVTLVNGKAEQEAAPGSTEKIVTQYFGNAVEVDLNSDGRMDSAFLLTQSPGGSGTFFYVAAAIQNPGGTYQGTNAIFLGDRIAPQSTNVDPNNPAQFTVSYGEVPAGSPATGKPTQMVSKTFKLDNGVLVEVPAASTQTQGAKSPQNATYVINGQPVTLVNGKAEQPAAPGSAEKIVTQYFGNAVEIDLNSDGKMDSGFLLTQTTGGTGTFFYVAAATQNPDGTYQGTNAIFLGDRIAPQSTHVDPNHPAQFIVNYADRAPGQPMSAQPTQGVSKTFKLDNGTLVEVSPAS